MNTQVIVLGEKQISQATEILVNAFSQDPLLEYIFPPESSQKEKISHRFSEINLRYAQAFNHIYTTSDIKGIAAWIPPNKYPLNFLKMLVKKIVAFFIAIVVVMSVKRGFLTIHAEDAILTESRTNGE